jgi:polygalacturonase
VKAPILIPLLLSAGGVLAASNACAWESALFGPGWDATPALSFESDKILQDFSYAGYRRGEVPLPDKPPGKTFDATWFGADPSGTKDSTEAIQQALDAAVAAGGGIVLLPAGTYRLGPREGKNYSWVFRAATSCSGVRDPEKLFSSTRRRS